MRTRVIDWQDSAQMRQHARGWTGLQIMGCRGPHAASGGPSVGHAEFDITFLRRLTPQSSTLGATGKVVNLGRTAAYAEGEFRDEAGNLAAHAVGNFSIIELRTA